MAKVTNVEVVSIEGCRSICIDWDNDRHQQVSMEGDRPDDLIKAFERMAYLLVVHSWLFPAKNMPV